MDTYKVIENAVDGKYSIKSERLHYLKLWYNEEEVKLYLNCIKNRDNRRLKSLCRCSKSSAKVCPACEIINLSLLRKV